VRLSKRSGMVQIIGRLAVGSSRMQYTVSYK